MLEWRRNPGQNPGHLPAVVHIVLRTGVVAGENERCYRADVVPQADFAVYVHAATQQHQRGEPEASRRFRAVLRLLQHPQLVRRSQCAHV